MSDSEEEGGLSLDSVFTEPPRPPSPEPTITTYTRERKPDHSDWSSIDIRLVGSHPLWAHHLWNASRAFASYLDEYPELYRDSTVLELGAGGALPGIVAAKNGAKTVVITDYPDVALVDNMSHNVRENIHESDRAKVHVEGYIWGHAVEPLLALLPAQSEADERAFDLIILSDLIFNHSQHEAMLKSCELALSKRKPSESPEGGAQSRPPPCALVFYTHHRPHLADRDMDFFTKARERGWHCEEILTRRYPPMFPEDPGEEEVRATVHGWRLTRA
ncbi:Protein N-methyltransferase nnt1 [Trametes pubescens]|uniref:Protein N-terminal and lysine N-methyltransferase EFM7 n=1 Tax=Trametes pubescens TaxID=154538 RepID=A0A1M2VFW9_TRAPU|nr:Protein N-methyltransferase nnt1 [Trametes pubescens]